MKVLLQRLFIGMSKVYMFLTSFLPQSNESCPSRNGQAKDGHLGEEDGQEGAGNATSRLAAPVADAVDDAGNQEDEAKDRGGDRVAQAAGQHVHQEEGQLLKSVLQCE